MSPEAQVRHDREAILTALRRWYQELNEARGDRAALRRCGTPGEVIFVPAYHRLYHALAPHGWASKSAVAAVAGLTSLVRHDVQDATLAKQMAQPRSSGGGPRLSELRFRRLLKFQDRQELYPALGRVIRSLDGRVNLVDLAESVYWWNEQTRQRWAFDYYSVAP